MNRFQQLVVGQREVILYLPPSYETTNRFYPVAYVQDGGDLFTDGLNYLEHLFADNRLEEAILVGVVTPSRNDEYTPWPADPLLDGYPAFGGSGKAYVDELADVVKPYIDSRYRTLKEADSTAMIGASLGGLVSLFAGFWRPDAFGRIGLLSASFWYEGVMDYIRSHEALGLEQRVYMSFGSCEGIYKTSIQKNMVPCSKEAHRLWLEKGYPKSHLKLAIDPDGTHDALFMLKHFPEALKWLFDKGAASPDNHLNADLGAYRVPGTRTWEMKSSRTGREYRIFIAVPVVPPPEEGYPVLYALDANASFGSLAESLRLQSRGPHGIPPALIVGIGYDSEDPIVSKERFIDYTVHADETELPPRPNGSAWPATGGAEAFLAFIEEELKPAIERSFPVNRAKQSFFGHSLGGFLTLYALFTRPAAFRRYIAASPSIWWKNHMLLELLNAKKAGFESLEPGAELLLCVGSGEKPSMIADAKKLHQALDSVVGLPHSFLEVEGEGHVSVLPALISPLLRYVTG